MQAHFIPLILFAFSLTVSALPGVQEEMQMRRAAIKEGHKNLEIQKSRSAVLEQKHEQFDSEWREVKKGHSTRKDWEEKLGERKKVDANIRAHELAGKLIMRKDVHVGQAMLERASGTLKSKQQEIQKEMNAIKEKGHHDPELVKAHEQQHSKDEVKICHAKNDCHFAIMQQDKAIDAHTDALYKAYTKNQRSKYNPAKIAESIKDRMAYAQLRIKPRRKAT
ncbi:uncharacterized protein FA14DRAFT_172007 [Meira miltonrushii]|uniref:Uncharacterized protein n=1 Tax=Meira miltonrushii TaxID=1280837 RepID=A0A316VCG2_9BASI|nr:uncharacterized protein FA14DRAFT_172007 [Meira miltonrushii]PWN35357.1 hypothetical protein FA14DRAFT_172007 [Meira miltonrushii]